MVFLFMPGNYEVVFYTDINGDSPITDFLNNCSDSLRSKILRQFMYVAEFGISYKIPNIKKVTGTSFWELRILGNDNIRIFCIGNRRNVYIVHIFSKKKQKTPAKEIRVAENRIDDLDF
jgi:phage-related protein